MVRPHRSKALVALLCIVASFGIDVAARADDVPAPGAVPFPVATDRAPTIASLRRAFPGRRVWRVTRYGENDPGFPIRAFCIGRGRRCSLELSLTQDGSIHGLEVRDASLAGPRGIRVGATYRSLESVLEDDCMVSLGDETGMFCDVEGEPTVRVALMAPGLDDVRDRSSETPTTAELDAARVVSFHWGLPER